MSPTRREFLAGALATAGLAAAAGCSSGDDEGSDDRRSERSGSTTTSEAAPVRAPSNPEDSQIDHIVVLMMENRSFDHYLGWLEGADGKQAGLTFVDDEGNEHETHHLTDFQGCDHPDPDHGYDGGRRQLNGGKCDGFVTGRNDEYAVGYYTADDLPFTASAAQEFCTFDRYFCATMGPTYPNRFFQHAAATDRTSNSFDIAQTTTIWDRLAAKDVSAAYYFNDAPFIALWGGKYGEITKPYDEFLAAAEKGTLPAVSFLDPKFLNSEGKGTSMDDHPHADIRAGQWFQNQVYEALSGGPRWDRTLFVINYDEWGGFYDHVAPEEAPDARPDLGTGLRGFRVPCLAIGPRVRRGSIGHEVYDHTSILKLIEWRHDLASITPRDEEARNLAEVLDLEGKPNLDAPRWDVPEVESAACPPEAETSELQGLRRTSATIRPAGEGGVLEGDADDGYEEWRTVRRIADRFGFPAPYVP